MEQSVRIIGDPLLRRPSQAISFPMGEENLQAGRDLIDTLEAFRGRMGFGRAIAAPQIGISRRMIALHLEDKPFLMINPEITWRSGQRFSVEDDCMSFPDLLVRLQRERSISISYQDEDGLWKTMEDLDPECSELLQHEIDHLDGILAVDWAWGEHAVWSKQSGITFEQARMDHASAFCRLVDMVARQRRYLAATEGFPEEMARDFVAEIEKNNLSQYYAFDGERLIGWCDILPKAFEGMRHVANLGMGLHPDYRGKGIGSQLLLLASDHALHVNEVEKIELEVFSSNGGAVAFYEKHGFVREGKRKRSRKLDGAYDDILLMGKEL